MGQYYYFAASLPMLKYGLTPPINSKSFLDDCSRLVSISDYKKIKKAKLSGNPPTDSTGILKDWIESEAGLRNELVKLRTKKENTETEKYIRNNFVNPLWASKAKEIFDTENPLNAEKLFIKALWEILSDLETGHDFDTEMLIVYYIKLQLLERMNSFQIDKGKEKLETILSGERI